MAVTHFVTQLTHVSRNFRAWNRKQKYFSREKYFKILCQKFTKMTCFVLIISQRLKMFLCLLFFIFYLFFALFLWTQQHFWDHIFKTVFPNDLFCLFCNLHSRSPNFCNYFFQIIFTDNLIHFFTNLRTHNQNSFYTHFFFFFV